MCCGERGWEEVDKVGEAGIRECKPTDHMCVIQVAQRSRVNQDQVRDNPGAGLAYGTRLSCCVTDEIQGPAYTRSGVVWRQQEKVLSPNWLNCLATRCRDLSFLSRKIEEKARGRERQKREVADSGSGENFLLWREGKVARSGCSRYPPCALPVRSLCPPCGPPVGMELGVI